MSAVPVKDAGTHCLPLFMLQKPHAGGTGRIYRSSFRSPSLIQPIRRKNQPKRRVRTAGSRKQTIRMPIYMDAPPSGMAV